MYSELLDHWQKVTKQLCEQQAKAKREKTVVRYH